MRNWWKNQYIFDAILFTCKKDIQHLVSPSILRTNNRKQLPVLKQMFQTGLRVSVTCLAQPPWTSTTAFVVFYTQHLLWDKIHFFSDGEMWAKTTEQFTPGPCPFMGTIYARSQFLRLFRPAKNEASELHAPFQPLVIPAYSAPSFYKNTWSTSIRTATSFTCAFGKIRYTHNRWWGPLSRFKNATFMPLTLLTRILASCSKRDSKWSTRGCFHIRWQVLIQRQETENNPWGWYF